MGRWGMFRYGQGEGMDEAVASPIVNQVEYGIRVLIW